MQMLRLCTKKQSSGQSKSQCPRTSQGARSRQRANGQGNSKAKCTGKRNAQAYTKQACKIESKREQQTQVQI